MQHFVSHVQNNAFLNRYTETFKFIDLMAYNQNNFICQPLHLTLNGPAHEILVLIPLASSEGLGKSVHMQSLARASLLAYAQSMEIDKGRDKKLDL